MNLRRIAETETVITLGWDPVPGQVGYVPSIDGNEKLTDGKRHIGYPSTATQVRIGKPQDGKPHTYGVRILGVEAEGEYATGAPGTWQVAKPQGTLAEMNGGGTQSHARFDYTVGPVTFVQKWIHDYTSYGYGLMQWPAQESPPGVRSTVSDLRVERITRTPPRSSNGTAEADVWIGQTADVYRLELAYGAWTQLWTGARNYRSVHSDIRMIGTQLVGIYPEHNTWDGVFRRFVNEESPGQLANVCNQEWAYGGEFSKGLVYDQFDLYVPKNCWAFFIDAGNGETLVAPSPGSRLWGPGNGVIFPKRIVPGVGPNRVWLENIDMSDLEGVKYAEHDNAIGSFTQRVAAATRGLVGLAPKHHPATVRMPSDLKVRLADLARSA